LFESNKGNHSGAVQTDGQHFYLYDTFNSVEDSIPESSFLSTFSDHTIELPRPLCLRTTRATPSHTRTPLSQFFSTNWKNVQWMCATVSLPLISLD